MVLESAPFFKLMKNTADIKKFFKLLWKTNRPMKKNTPLEYELEIQVRKNINDKDIKR